MNSPDFRFRYTSVPNVLKCLGFLAGWVFIWAMAIQSWLTSGLSIEGAILLIVFQLFLPIGLYMLRLLTSEVEISNDTVVYRDFKQRIVLARNEIEGLMVKPHVLGAGYQVVAKENTFVFSRQSQDSKGL